MRLLIFDGNHCNSERLVNPGFYLHTEEATGSIPVSPIFFKPSHIAPPLPATLSSFFVTVSWPIQDLHSLFQAFPVMMRMALRHHRRSSPRSAIAVCARRSSQSARRVANCRELPFSRDHHKRGAVTEELPSLVPLLTILSRRVYRTKVRRLPGPTTVLNCGRKRHVRHGSEGLWHR